MAVTPLSYLSESTLSIADSASAILSARPVTTATLSTMRYFIYQILKNYDLSKQSYTFSVTCFHIYPGWYQLIISKIIRTFATGGLMPDFYC